MGKTKTGITVQDLKRDYLFGVIGHFKNPACLTDEYLLNKLRGAEDDIARDLGILWNTTRIRSEPDPGDTDFDIEEPAYDYDAGFYEGERWGYIRLRRWPVQSVEQIFFAYPNQDSTIFKVPWDAATRKGWVKLDGDFGMIRLVPDKVSVFASFNSYILSVFSGGRGVPQSIFVDYTAGFKDVDAIKADFTDLLEHVKRTALVEIAGDALIPSSFSSNADGLSQTIAFDINKYREEQQRIRKVFRDRIKGVMMTVV